MNSPPDALPLQEMLAIPSVQLMSFKHAAAYARRFPYRSKVTFAAGALDLSKNILKMEVDMVGTTVNLIVRDELSRRFTLKKFQRLIWTQFINCAKRWICCGISSGALTPKQHRLHARWRHRGLRVVWPRQTVLNFSMPRARNSELGQRTHPFRRRRCECRSESQIFESTSPMCASQTSTFSAADAR